MQHIQIRVLITYYIYTLTPAYTYIACICNMIVSRYYIYNNMLNIVYIYIYIVVVC